MRAGEAIFSIGMALAVGAAAPGMAVRAAAPDPSFVLASTTSTENSGLFQHLLPKFKQDTGIDVRVVAVGTGAALNLGRRCDADGLLVHARAAELRYVAAGYGVDRRDVMYNDFVLVGPASDPAHVAGSADVVAALARIDRARATFLSRGDDSGTNDKELALWRDAHLDPATAGAKWYRETGSGMGPTLNAARAMGAYTLADRATWISFRNKGDLRILVEGDPRLFNPYGVMTVNPARCPTAKVALARKFEDWLLSPRGQAAIAGYRLDGQQLFHPDAR